MADAVADLRCPCEGRYFQVVFRYVRPPAGETRFAASANGYAREFQRCRLCGHFAGVHAMDLTALYSGDYVGSTYGDAEGLRRAFDRINALDPATSDNVARVARVLAFAAAHRPGLGCSGRPTVLDVGSGLGVFVQRMKAAGWNATALDRDVRAVRHARDIIGVDAVHADFREVGALGPFDAIAFNKVLEHVQDPAAMLERAHRHLDPHGFVYLEVPDGETAAANGPDREEFFIDHWHAFSRASVAMMAERATFRAVAIEGLREPSGKYTLRAFLTPRAADRGLAVE